MRDLENKLDGIKKYSWGKWVTEDGKLFIEIDTKFIRVLMDGKVHDFFNWKFSDRMEFGNFVILSASESLMRLSWFSGPRYNIGNSSQFILRRVSAGVPALVA